MKAGIATEAGEMPVARAMIDAVRSMAWVFCNVARVFSSVIVLMSFLTPPPNIPPSMPAMPPWPVFALAIPASMLGTAAGGWVLDRISDVDFKRWTAWIVTGIGLVYLVKAGQLAL